MTITDLLIVLLVMAGMLVMTALAFAPALLRLTDADTPTEITSDVADVTTLTAPTRDHGHHALAA